MTNSLVHTLLTLTLAVGLGPLALMAQAQGPMRATIPFDFTVDAKSFAAGDYSVRELGRNILLIQNLENKTAIITLTVGGEEPRKPNASSSLIFHRYGSSYFLSDVSGYSKGWKLPTSRNEREQIAKAASPTPVVLAVASHQDRR